MANRILGIDLGAYSVKLIIATPGFRGATVTDFIEQPVPPGDDPHLIRAVRVLGDIVRQYKLDHDVPYAAAAGDKLFIHILEFPFRNLRRAELEQAVGSELEGILPVDLEDMVFGFEALPGKLAEPPPESSDDSRAQAGQPAGDRMVGDDEPTQVQPRTLPVGIVHGRVAAPTTGMRVL
ncbi:MAG: hypothetical protein AAGC55_29290, partial [Myxococcota bacterium]